MNLIFIKLQLNFYISSKNYSQITLSYIQKIICYQKEKKINKQDYILPKSGWKFRR